MATRIPTTVPDEADVLEASLKGVDERLHDGLWDIWVDNPKFAQQLIARFKDNGATPSVRYKAAPGMQSVELPTGLATALTQARAQLGDAQLTQMLASAPQAGASLPDAVMAQLNGKAAPGAGTLTSDEKPPSRKKERKSMAQIFDEGIRELNR